MWEACTKLFGLNTEEYETCAKLGDFCEMLSSVTFMVAQGYAAECWHANLICEGTECRKFKYSRPPPTPAPHFRSVLFLCSSSSWPVGWLWASAYFRKVNQWFIWEVSWTVPGSGLGRSERLPLEVLVDRAGLESSERHKSKTKQQNNLLFQNVRSRIV